MSVLPNLIFCCVNIHSLNETCIKFMKFSISSFLQFALYVQEMILFVHNTRYFKMCKEKKQTKGFLKKKLK